MHDTVSGQVLDVLLWRQARRVAEAHQPNPTRPGRCSNLGCHGTPWPCPAHRLATNAMHAARAAAPTRRPGSRPPPAASWTRPSGTNHHTAFPPVRSTPTTHQPTPATPPASTPSPATPTAETGGTLDHPHPDQLRIGESGVFAGSWAWTGPHPATMRIPVGYAGLLEDWWNGWAVWSTTRDVIDAMLAEQHRLRRLARQQLVSDGHTGTDLRTRLDGLLPPMYLDGADLVVDEYANYDDDPLVRISPGHDGRYIPMGWHWTWIAVEPTRCDRIVGHLPPPPTR